MLSKLAPTAEASLKDILRTDNRKSWVVLQGFLLSVHPILGFFALGEGYKRIVSLLFASLNSLPYIFRRLIDLNVVYT